MFVDKSNPEDRERLRNRRTGVWDWWDRLGFISHISTSIYM